MAENLTKRVDNFAVYLPAMQKESARFIYDGKGTLHGMDAKFKIKATDLNWFEPKNKHWSYKWCLASAGHMAKDKSDNAITSKHEDAIVVGDSGGYQIGTGALSQTSGWTEHQSDTAHIRTLWKQSHIRDWIVEWLDVNCDYAMTIDMPLWVRGTNRSNSPFHKFSEDELIALSLDNLDYLVANRGVSGTCKFLNVLQAWGENANDGGASSLASEEKWYAAVKGYDLDGWSLGGEVGWRGGIYRVLRRMLTMRDDGLLADGHDWCHVLGVSQPIWAVYLTAIQRAIRNHNVNRNFTMSFDSASPYILGGVFQKYALHPSFGEDWNEWVLRHDLLATGYGIANQTYSDPFPSASPIASKFNMRQLNPKSGEFDPKTTDTMSDAIMVNHNVYVYIKSMIRANEAVFSRKPQAPKELVRAVGIIDELFAARDWRSMLEARKEYLQAVLLRAPIEDIDTSDERM